MAPQRTQARAQRGFTLIEMAIAVAIFGTLASGAILATSAWLAKQALDKTNKNLDRIESALTLHVVQNGRLPCPENPATGPGNPAGTCPTPGGNSVGTVPYRQLGLQRVDVVDGWNRYITYAVDDDWATGTPFGSPTTALRDFTTNQASLDVQDAGATSCSPNSAVCAAYVLISHGEPGRGAIPNYGVAAIGGAAGAEAENTDGDAVFAAEAFTGATVPFDHILRFRTPAQILRDAW